MKSNLIPSVALCVCFASSGSLAVPQHGTAAPGFYPLGYAGDTFTGVVTATDDTSRLITLTYTNPRNGKSESLAAYLKEEAKARWSDGTMHPLKPSDFKAGTHLKIWYLERQQKINGQKVRINTIWDFKIVSGS